ncbi:M50 family metallopeptidase [Oceanirhabdus sp. W0125-5]|uniref:M50 family metallopeptidase n=1 Tax=Oceanirhabdus sp. W0125-5 TaxID=2999116 RepID=UPI0022F3473D|nr:M50 family metallopeptidase [Oceanirhabdus sp. W0125-5]WBW97838.1 M50 family metallopeptidase [Oceanirhabdus sp. W0125-5]
MNIVMYIFQAILCYFCVITIHELGHTIVGILSGFRFELFVVGPFGVKRDENGKIIPYIEKNKAMWGGCAATVPINDNKDNFNKFANVLIGGPFASLVFGIIMLCLYAYESNFFILLLGSMAISISVATLIPMRAGCFYTDGGRWLRIKRKGYDSKVEMGIFNLTQSYYINQNYSKLSLEHTELLINDKDYRNQYLGHYFAYCYFKDNQDKNNGDIKVKVMKDLESNVPKNFVKLLPIEDVHM